VNAVERATLPVDAAPAAAGVADERMRELIERREAALGRTSRGWLVPRMLLLADVLGLVLAFLIAQLLYGREVSPNDGLSPGWEFAVFFLTLPAWIVGAKLYELYDIDEERADFTTVDELVRLFHLVTVGVWLLFAGSWLTGAADLNLKKLVSFWFLAIVFMTVFRGAARAFCRTRPSYIQKTVIVGAGSVGQLLGRKLLQHPEYGLQLLGFVDANPKELRDEVEHVPNLGSSAELAEIVRRQGVDRVVLAFSNDSLEETLGVVGALKHLNVQVDIVPRLFEVVGPNVNLHTLEGVPLVGLPSAKLFPFSRTFKRVVDVVCAVVGLVVTAPLFAFAAWRIKRDSPGPVFFRQERLGLNMKPFTALKFRTMVVDTDDSVHREFIRQTMSADATVNDNGLYKLDRGSAITPSGAWLRKTSLDELPQLINVLRGEMSIVGPRPCIEYETEFFQPHHFERFLVPAGITGLWQVTARAHSTFGEALDMDVTYARNWSLGLDLWLILKTPFQVLRQKRGTA
jgi:exopolysaccharide biosynthesis polyprenyl glycosylphosphotransferase